MLSLQHI